MRPKLRLKVIVDNRSPQLNCPEDESSVETKALKSLSVLLLVFVCTRFSSTAISNIMNFAGASREAIDCAHGYAALKCTVTFSVDPPLNTVHRIDRRDTLPVSH
ncbi:hypothetical protein PRIPAC_94921 [Pristionchus pacificus]|uniref:Uncharacterized protein n=1 Tax=Pristionchus pacificus TaxID=54126 RepID=A0A2A6BP49_PRIPA|nr:hypothetical protein PRIPAC_94921 [Pristionchus pacificus]|eukprot:PDM67687.1 hypothetical protein PRIPAC_45731 [Pristionchus pacificus]